MKRIVILIVLGVLMATSLALTASVAWASHGTQPCDQGYRVLVFPETAPQHGGPFYTCVPTGDPSHP
jgi:hypothetical protein